MDKRLFRNILIILLGIALVYFVSSYILQLKDNISNLESQKQNLLQELEKEKASLERLQIKNNILKSNLRATHKRLNKSFSDSRLSEKRFEELNSQITALKLENASLSEDRAKITKENESYKATLTSIPELKSIIQELKRLARSKGNRGFLIKSGQSTTASKVKIEVIPAPSK